MMPAAWLESKIWLYDERLMAKPEQEQGSSTRRKVLKTLAAGAVSLPIIGQDLTSANVHSSTPVTQEAATKYHYRYFRTEQLNTLDALTETIIPTDEHSPGAKAAGVSEYIDAIVADAPESTKEFWNNGLAMVDDMAENSFGKPYAQCSTDEQFAIMSELAAYENHPSSREGQFFTALKRATIDGYYTSHIGIHQDLQYQGNRALDTFPGCQQAHILNRS
jgi:gluconate 2-dehydrogenase gamma chain